MARILGSDKLGPNSDTGGCPDGHGHSLKGECPNVRQPAVIAAFAATRARRHLRRSARRHRHRLAPLHYYRRGKRESDWNMLIIPMA